MYGRCGRVSTESWSKKEEVVMVELWLREGELEMDRARKEGRWVQGYFTRQTRRAR